MAEQATTTAMQAIANYFDTTPIVVGLSICAIALGVIVAVFSVGIRWVKWTEDGDL